ncbi:hypothetical protein AB1Y20_010243 [Prymnesium parvum]|uniref:Uncharacterized protein n=1 Tax=Prymnesium parvum TaxID=97485 RepID=A0AB34K3X1_PRYPA
MQLDVVLVAEGARASGAALSTPRYEPSWFFDEIDDALVDACMRPRRREQVSGETREWLYRHLLACGHEANAKGHHFMAHAWFECAYLTKDDLSAFISSVNMRMRLGQATLASRLYERLLQRTLTDAHREVVERKLKEATGAKTSRSHAPRTAGIPQDEDRNRPPPPAPPRLRSLCLTLAASLSPLTLSPLTLAPHSRPSLSPPPHSHPSLSPITLAPHSHPSLPPLTLAPHSRRLTLASRPFREQLAQLLDPARAAQEVEGEERERLLKLLRRRGHACNEEHEYENAHYWFDCAYALEHQISDLLSAANMRLKLVDISPVAEALYLHVLTELHVSEREKAMAERKLSQLKENTRNLSASQEYTLVAEL